MIASFRTLFQPGAHVSVRRQLKVAGVATGIRYWHHGIVIDDGDVVDFGGGHVLRKDATQVRRIALDAFRDGCELRVVSHPITHRGITYSDPLPPDVVVDRALWLCTNQPPAYRIGYRNCESIAVWCATGDFESFQVKRFMLWKARLVAPVVAYVRPRQPKVGRPLAVASILVALLTAVPYIHSRRFFDHVRAYPGPGAWGRGDRT